MQKERQIINLAKSYDRYDTFEKRFYLIFKFINLNLLVFYLFSCHCLLC